MTAVLRYSFNVEYHEIMEVVLFEHGDLINFMSFRLGTGDKSYIRGISKLKYVV